MIEFKSGDILKEDAEALINTVNCVGVMGRGIALQFKKAYPDNFKEYAKACKDNAVVPGKMFVYHTGQLTNPRYIINFPTKRHWKGKSRIEDIETGLNDLASIIENLDIKSIAIPPLGSGLGGLEWSEVRSLIENKLEKFKEGSIEIRIFEPKGAPESDKMIHHHEVPKMTAGRASLIELVHRYVDGMLDPYITLLEIHKLMYFMQEAGEPLRLKYQQADYGPYAENLRHVLTRIEGHFLSGYADGGDNPNKMLTIVPGAIEEARDFIDSQKSTKERFDRVSNLVEGFESPLGLELLSTVHWVTKRSKTSDPEEVTNAIYSWNHRKQQFTKRQIKLALSTLADNGWMQ